MKSKSIFLLVLLLSTFNLFAESTELWRIPTYYANVRMAEVSNSGDFFAGIHQQRPALQIFDLRTGDIIQTKEIDFEVLDMKFSLNEDKLELYSYHNDVFVLNTIDLVSSHLSTEKTFSDMKPQKLRFKDSKIFTLLSDGSMKIWDRNTKEELDFPELKKYDISNFNIADSIALIHSNDTIFIFNYKTGYKYISFGYVYKDNLDYAINIDLNKVYVGNIYNDISVERFDLSTGDFVDRWTNKPQRAWFFNNEIVIGQIENNIYFLDMYSGELIDEIEIGSKYYVVNDDLSILLSVGENKIEYWDLISKTKEYEWSEEKIHSFFFTKDSKNIIINKENSQFSKMHDVTTGQLQFEDKFYINELFFLRNYDEYIDYFKDSLVADSVQLIDIYTEKINESFVLPDKYFGCFIPQTKEYIFFLSDFDSIHVHDYESKDHIFSYKIDMDFTHWSYTGRYLIGPETFDSYLFIYDCNSRQRIFEDTGNEIYNYHFGEEEDILYYQIKDDGIYRLFINSLVSEKIFNYESEGTAFKTLDNNFFFTEKDFFVEGVNKGDINFRKYKNEEIIFTVDDYPVDINIIALSDDHTKLAVSYWDGAFIMYDLGDALSVDADVYNLSIVSSPNPFSVSTTISYEFENAGYVSMSVFDALGTEVARLIDEYKEAGRHEYNFDATGLPSGMYFLNISIGADTFTEKLIIKK